MNQNRKDQDARRGSVMDDKESFEHGSRDSEMTRGMGSSGERGHAGDDSSFKSGDSRPKSKKIRSLEDLPAPGWKMEER